MSRITNDLADLLEQLVVEKIEEQKDESDLDDKIEKEVENARDNFEVEADKVDGLDRFVEDALDGFDISDKISDGIKEEIGDLEGKIKDETNTQLKVLLDSPEFQAKLDQAVKSSLLRVIQGFLGGLITTPSSNLSGCDSPAV